MVFDRWYLCWYKCQDGYWDNWYGFWKGIVLIFHTDIGYDCAIWLFGISMGIWNLRDVYISTHESKIYWYWCIYIIISDSIVWYMMCDVEINIICFMISEIYLYTKHCAYCFLSATLLLRATIFCDKIVWFKQPNWQNIYTTETTLNWLLTNSEYRNTGLILQNDGSCGWESIYIACQGIFSILQLITLIIFIITTCTTNIILYKNWVYAQLRIFVLNNHLTLSSYLDCISTQIITDSFPKKYFKSNWISFSQICRVEYVINISNQSTPYIQANSITTL